MTRPNELLAAYAAGGLSKQEQQRVEAYLADDAEARAELAELRALIDAARDAKPLPDSEPAWDDMARSIRLAVDDVKLSWWRRTGARTFSWLRARPLLVSGATAVALGVTLYVAATAGPDARSHTNTADGFADRAPSEPEPELDIDIDIDIALPDLEEAWDADSIVYELDPEDEFEDMFATADEDDDTEPSIDFMISPELDSLLDSLTEEEIEALDARIDAYLKGTPS